jgi:broad specificity phosphatase PhoE
MTKFLFIRHGQLEGENRKVLHHFQDPVSLSKEGKETMQKIAPYLVDTSPSILYTSPETRTKESAEMLASTLGIQINTLPSLTGRDWGDFAGKEWNEVEHILREKTLEERYLYKPPRGESWKTFEERILGALADIAGKEMGVVGVIAHGSVIRVLLPKVFGVGTEESLDLYPDYGSVSSVKYDEGSYRDPELHLESLGEGVLSSRP